MRRKSKRPTVRSVGLLLLAGEEMNRRMVMKKLKQSQYYGIGILVLMLVVFWAVFKVLAPTTFGSPDKLATYMKSA